MAQLNAYIIKESIQDVEAETIRCLRDFGVKFTKREEASGLIQIHLNHKRLGEVGSIELCSYRKKVRFRILGPPYPSDKDVLEFAYQTRIPSENDPLEIFLSPFRKEKIRGTEDYTAIERLKMAYEGDETKSSYVHKPTKKEIQAARQELERLREKIYQKKISYCDMVSAGIIENLRKTGFLLRDISELPPEYSWLDPLDLEILRAYNELKSKSIPATDKMIVARIAAGPMGRTYSREWVNRKRNKMRKKGIEV